MVNERFCISCNNRIKGRLDKKFCSDQCRSRYNYVSKTALVISSFNDVDRILKNNRAILNTLYRKGKRKVSKLLLVSKGFDFEYYTNIRQAGMKNLCFFCYDIGYSIINDLEVALVKCGQ